MVFPVYHCGENCLVACLGTQSGLGWWSPPAIRSAWKHLRDILSLLSLKHIPRCYFTKEVCVTSVQLHRFCDASESAYAGIVYLCTLDFNDWVHITIVASKTKVVPIKCLSIPHLELNGANLLAKLLYHLKEVFLFPPKMCMHGRTAPSSCVGWLETLNASKSTSATVFLRLWAHHPDHWNHIVEWISLLIALPEVLFHPNSWLTNYVCKPTSVKAYICVLVSLLICQGCPSGAIVSNLMT